MQQNVTMLFFSPKLHERNVDESFAKNLEHHSTTPGPNLEKYCKSQLKKDLQLDLIFCD